MTTLTIEISPNTHIQVLASCNKIAFLSEIKSKVCKIIYVTAKYNEFGPEELMEYFDISTMEGDIKFEFFTRGDFSYGDFWNNCCVKITGVLCGTKIDKNITLPLIEWCRQQLLLKHVQDTRLNGWMQSLQSQTN